MDDLQSMTRDELIRRLRSGSVRVLDVRPLAEYRAGHIPGALSVPPGDVRAALAGLSGDVEIVAYCRGPYCVFAVEAVRALRQAGLRGARLEDGFPEWRRAGLPVAVGDEPGQLTGHGRPFRRTARRNIEAPR